VISLSASESPPPPAREQNTGRAFVGGAFSVVGRGRSPRTPSPTHTYRDNTGRTDLAVSVQNLSVTYRTRFERVPTFKKAITRRQRAIMQIEALRDVSFDVPAGTSMGIIGSNGAGKSTLLRTLAGILSPTEGRVEVWGRASTLLALGVGFNVNLSGRENVRLGGLAAGMSKREVEERAHEIAEWAELGEFIDAPLRTYSSGMFSRLAFSVAVHMNPDILMVDEALSAGDAKFREKADAKMAELRDSARAMFLVSHGLSSIQEMCDDCLWLHKGRVMMHGSPVDCITAYTEFVKVGRTPSTMEEI
jgi:ABC-type polysaccharide/polyol phosphate transport system ATPase subunit